jgi:hypothetical protein
MIGIYIECEWCGDIQRTTVSRTKRQFRAFMKKQKWIYVKDSRNIEWDFCSDECYQKWKRNQ